MLEIIEDSVVYASNILDDLKDITLVGKPEANSVNVRSFLKHARARSRPRISRTL